MLKTYNKKVQNTLERFRQKNQCKKHDEIVTELSREALLTSLTICSVKILANFPQRRNNHKWDFSSYCNYVGTFF